MKQMRFLDNVRTPEDWQRRALKAAEADAMKPKLKKWQSAGIVAVTAALVLSIGVIPLLNLDRAVNSNIGTVDSSSVSSDLTGEEDDVLPVMDGIKEAKEIDVLKASYDYVETFTVLDSQMMDDGTLLVAGAREKYKMGNGMLCVRVPKEKLSDGDTKAEAPVFGDRVCVAFKKVRGEGLVEIPTTLTINGRDYTAKQATDAVYADYYKPMGQTADTLFSDLVKSACAATGYTNSDFGEEAKDLVRCYYANAERVKPSFDNNTKFIRDRYLLDARSTLFDERYSKNGMPSQLFVTAIANLGYGEFETGVTEKDGVYTLKLGKHTGRLDVSCSTKVDILNVEMVPDPKYKDTAYLLVNLADKEGTGNIRGVVAFDITLEDGSTTKTNTPKTKKTIPIDIDDKGFDFKVDVQNIYFPDDETSDEDLSRYYRFEFILTPKDDTDLSKLRFSKDPDFPEKLDFEISGLESYAVTAQCACEYAQLLIPKQEPQENGDYIMELMLYYEGEDTEILPAKITFGKVDDSGEMSVDLVVDIGRE